MLREAYPPHLTFDIVEYVWSIRNRGNWCHVFDPDRNRDIDHDI